MINSLYHPETPFLLDYPRPKSISNLILKPDFGNWAFILKTNPRQGSVSQTNISNEKFFLSA